MSWNVIYQNDSKKIYLDQIVRSIRWSGDIKQAARKLVVELSNTEDLRDPLFTLEKGKEIQLYVDETEQFRGVIFSDSINASGQLTITAYDENIYLTKNTDTKIFRNLTASSIIKRLCSDFSIPTGQIDDTGFIIPKLICREKTLYDMMITSLTISEKQTGNKFMISSREGKLHLLARQEQKVKWVLENGINILDASYSQSIEELRTQVKVIGGDTERFPLTAQAQDQALIQKFGVMQHVESAERDMTKSQMEQLAKQRLKDLGTIDDEARVECLGNIEVISGTAVYVKESMTGILGGYYISADEHSFQQGVHRMSLTLSATDDLPKMEYEDRKGL